MRGQDPASMKRHGARVVPILLSLVCTGLCQTDCFGTLLALNNEMQTELIRIRNGATPNSEYLYNLCPNTFFDTASTALEPVLSNSKFVCGENGSRTDRCVMLGGSTQVRISDSLVEGYPLEELTFMGITFSGFQSNNNRRGSSIAAQASSVTTATFTDCEWQVSEKTSECTFK